MSQDSWPSGLLAYARTPDGQDCSQTPGVPTHENAIRGMGLHIDAHTQTRKIEEQRGKKKRSNIQGTLR
jgi:hypothetical protein